MQSSTQKIFMSSIKIVKQMERKKRFPAAFITKKDKIMQPSRQKN